MKINSLTKIISKKLLLALAAFSFTTAAHADYSGGYYSGVTDSSGGFIFTFESLSFTSSQITGNWTTEITSQGNERIQFELLQSVFTTTTDYFLMYNASDDFQALSIMLFESYMGANNTSLHFSGNGGMFTITDGSTLSLNAGAEILNAMDVTTYPLYLNVAIGSNLLARTRGQIHLNLDCSTWKTIGSSDVMELRAMDSKINLVMTSGTDHITAIDFIFFGESTISLDFSESFIEEIVNGAGYFEGNVFDTIVSANGGVDDENLFDIGTSNSLYTWDVTRLIGGDYRIDNIQMIPEPSTYAAIFGVLALGLAIYRRRK